MGKESVGNFYKADVRFLKEIVGRESEFEKPYEDEDYRKMHFDFPWPDWPPFPDFPPWPPWPDLPVPAPRANWCILASPFGALDCEGEVTFWVTVCGVPEKGNLCNSGDPSRWKVQGDYTTITDDFLGIVVGIDKEAALQRPDKKALIQACFTDPSGNVCCEEATVLCKPCPPDISISWDTATETIGQSDTLVVSVKDGLGPYTWSVAGTGFSMLNATTVGVSNTLQSDASACGTATITVTDDCDETTTGYVRCTADSGWVKKGDVTADYDGGITWCYGAAYQFGTTELIRGEERWTFLSVGTNCMTAAPNSVWDPDTGTFVDPPCGNPFPCSPTVGLACSGTSPVGCTGYLQMTSSSYYQWECN